MGDQMHGPDAGRERQDRSSTGDGSTLVTSVVRPSRLIIRGQGAAVALDLLAKWSQEDPHEQRETWEYLKRALDNERISVRWTTSGQAGPDGLHR